MTQTDQDTSTAENALPELHGSLAARGLRFAVARGVDRGTAEELVQEAFLRLIPRAAEVAPGHFTGLFFVTLRHLVVDALRARTGLRVTSLDDEPELAAMAPQDLDAAPMEERLGELRKTLHELMKTLPPRHAEALELKVNGDLSYDQIAEVLGATHAQVRTWIHRARQQLRAALTRAASEAARVPAFGQASPGGAS